MPSATQQSTDTPLCAACLTGQRPGQQPDTAHFWCEPYSKALAAQRCSRCGQCADHLGLFHPFALDCYSSSDQQQEQRSQPVWKMLTTTNSKSSSSSSTGMSSWKRRAVIVSPQIESAGTSMTVAEVHHASVKLLARGSTTRQDAEQIVTAALTGAPCSSSHRDASHAEAQCGSTQHGTEYCGPSTAKQTPQEVAQQAAADPGLMGYLLCCFTSMCS